MTFIFGDKASLDCGKIREWLNLRFDDLSYSSSWWARLVTSSTQLFVKTRISVVTILLPSSLRSQHIAFDSNSSIACDRNAYHNKLCKWFDRIAAHRFSFHPKKATTTRCSTEFAHVKQHFSIVFHSSSHLESIRTLWIIFQTILMSSFRTSMKNTTILNKFSYRIVFSSAFALGWTQERHQWWRDRRGLPKSA